MSKNYQRLNPRFLNFTDFEYENYYKSNYWRLHGIQTNFSYNMYNYIKQLDFDGTRIRGRNGWVNLNY